MHYELIYAGNCKWSKRLEDLQHLAKSIQEPWEIYLVIEMSAQVILNELELFGTGGVKSVIEQVERGVSKRMLIKRYGISLESLNRYIRLYKQRNP